MDLSKPQEQRTIQERDSAAIALAQFAGRTAANNLWIELMMALFRGAVFCPKWG